MPILDPAQIRRDAELQALRGPTSSTMPVGDRTRHVAPVGDMGTLQGYDPRNFADPTMQSVKYRHGRLAGGIRRPSEMAALVRSPAYQQAFPGATFNGLDRINFQGALSDGESGSPVWDIDVLRAADQGQDVSEGGWWGADEGTPVMPGGGMSPMGSPAGDNSSLAKIMKELSAVRDGGQSPSQRDAIMALLQGGI